MASRSHVRIYEGSISEIFSPAGAAGLSLGDLTKVVSNQSAVITPRRPNSGRMARGYRSGGVTKVGRYKVRGHVINVEPHSKFVIEGTMGPIRPETTDYMPVPVSRAIPALRNNGGRLTKGNKKLYFPAASVRGQEGVNYPLRAARLVVSSKRWGRFRSGLL